MSSSGSSGGRTLACQPEETIIKQLVRDLARSNMRISDEDVFTPYEIGPASK